MIEDEKEPRKGDSHMVKSTTAEMEMSILNGLGVKKMLGWVEADAEAVREQKEVQLKEKAEEGAVAHNVRITTHSIVYIWLGIIVNGLKYYSLHVKAAHDTIWLISWTRSSGLYHDQTCILLKDRTIAFECRSMQNAVVS